MEYEIKITMYAKNENYYKELEEWNKNNANRYHSPQDAMPEKAFPVKCLETRLDQEQFEVVRKAVLEVM